VSYWRDGVLWCLNYETQRGLPIEPALLELLASLDAWTTVRELGPRLGGATAAERRRLLDLLCRATLLERAATRPGRRPPLADWAAWNPIAGLFHMATRDQRYVESYSRRTGRRLRGSPGESTSFKPCGAPAIDLPEPQVPGSLADALAARRTWRRFGEAPVSLAEVSTLLRVGWGVQGWRPLDGGPARVARKTHPSGGARFPTEVYLLALDVTGLPRGWYHFHAPSHRLSPLGPVRRRARVETYLPTQWWYSGAAALVVTTAVFARMRQRYPYPRAYRAILLEAGHACQTFCLLATALGLAPFATAAFADSALERALGLNGVDEAALYVAGVGTRPPELRDAAPDDPRIGRPRAQGRSARRSRS
jgi:SagB-type dehydrogenase family enzyme